VSGYGTHRIIQGDALEQLRKLPDGLARACVTSPPFWWLRDYGVDGQIGLEADPAAFVETLVEVFREVRRVLTDDGTLWVNMGDRYGGSGCGGVSPDKTTLGGTAKSQNASKIGTPSRARLRALGIKDKDLLGVPWELALALRKDGWYLRSEVIWYKVNAQPENVNDRPARDHETIFLLSKGIRYFYDLDSVKVPASSNTHSRVRKCAAVRIREARENGVPTSQAGRRGAARSLGNNGFVKRNDSFEAATALHVEHRNLRTVWSIQLQGHGGDHRAVFPAEIPRRCIIAGTREGDTVLDPFAGTGTTLGVAENLGRHGLGIELNPETIVEAEERIAKMLRPNTARTLREREAPLFTRTECER